MFVDDEMVAAARRGGHGYQEILRAAALSAGIYVLPKGAVDRQYPHREDEVYYAVRGRGRFRRGEEELEVAPGSLLYVPAHQPHGFHDIEEELVLLVVFAPAETHAAPGG